MISLLKILITPTCWIQNEPYSPRWERELRDLMSKHQFEIESSHIAKLGDQRIWIANHPYASFTPIPESSYCTVLPARPKRKTLFEAMEKLIRDSVSEGQNQ